MISVIIPCFNSEEYLSRAIESVLKQTYTDYEIILVNNNSSDNTINILNDYSKRHPKIIKVLHEYKKGAPAARNKGLYEAKGEWIQSLDADDEILTNKLETQIVVASNSRANIIVGSCYLYKTIKNRIDIKIRDIETGNIWKGLLLSKLGITSSNLWRRKATLAVGGWNETKSSSQEYDLLFRILKNSNRIDFCILPLTIIHVRESSLHKSRDENRLIEIMDNNVKLRLEIKGYLKSKGILTKQLTHIADTYIYSYLVNTTGVFPFPLSVKKGKLPEYVRKTLQESNLKLPVSFIITFHLKRLIKKIKNRL